MRRRGGQTGGGPDRCACQTRFPTVSSGGNANRSRCRAGETASTTSVGRQETKGNRPRRLSPMSGFPLVQCREDGEWGGIETRRSGHGNHRRSGSGSTSSSNAKRSPAQSRTSLCRSRSLKGNSWIAQGSLLRGDPVSGTSQRCLIAEGVRFAQRLGKSAFLSVDAMDCGKSNSARESSRRHASSHPLQG